MISSDQNFKGENISSYFWLGFKHIAGAADHIAFLIALLMICRGIRQILWLVTGFTIGHSISLSLAVFNLVNINVNVIEAFIGFTIAFVALENTAMGIRSIIPVTLVSTLLIIVVALASKFLGTGMPMIAFAGLALFTICYFPLVRERAEIERIRPAITLIFGLIHGFGFAQAMTELHLSSGRIFSALLGFNLGVEFGQLLIVTLLLISVFYIRKIWKAANNHLTLDIISSILCGLGTFWFVNRSL